MYLYDRFCGGPIWCRLALLAMSVLLAGPCPFVGAKMPTVLEFDVPFTISCRSLPLNKSPDPAKELIEAVFPISAHVRAGTEKDLKQCLYTLVEPAEPGVFLVTDWLPKAELKTEFAKPIQFNTERLAKVGISLSAHYIVPAAGDAGGQLKSGVTYEMLPSVTRWTVIERLL